MNITNSSERKYFFQRISKDHVTNMANYDVIDLCTRKPSKENKTADLVRTRNPILYSQLEEELVRGFVDENFEAVLENLNNLILKLNKFKIELGILEGTENIGSNFEVIHRLQLCGYFNCLEEFKGFNSENLNNLKARKNMLKLKMMLVEKEINEKWLSKNCKGFQNLYSVSYEKQLSESLPDGLCLEHSVTGTGFGVKTTIPIAKGVLFGPYEGAIVSAANNHAMDSGYAWKISGPNEPSQFLDAKSVAHSNWLRYINMAFGNEQQNLVMLVSQKQVYYYAYKDIPSNSELLVWYEKSYADFLGYVSDDPGAIPLLLFSPIGSPSFGCSKCKQQFVSQTFLEQHVRKRHGGHPPFYKRFPCPYCNYSTNTYTHLIFHLRVHTGEKPHQCRICGKSFTHSGNLTAHMHTHAGKPQPYKCQICGSQFGRISLLQRHAKVHTRKAVHECPYCQKRFVRKTVLTIHIRTHTGQKPYRCNECDKCFSQLSALKTHAIFWHTGNFPHKCKECGMGFVYPSQLNKHITRLHSLS